MSEAHLDQIVKGVPIGSVKRLAQEPPAPLVSHHSSTSRGSRQDLVVDPLSTLPSSPPQIYLNLLILESSLRSQYLALRARRRQYTFFLLLLIVWIAYFAYALFLRPREDGSGMGGSVYWVVETVEKLALMGGVVTGILIWGTGQWERGVRWPRRWLGVANRGLRGMNAKIVIIRGPWLQELLSNLVFLFPYSSFFSAPGFSYHYVESLEKGPSASGGVRSSVYDAEHGGSVVEEDLAPGGDHIKLLLLPKFFSPEFRENWDEYRTEYWEQENERRAHLRRRVLFRERQLAKQEGGWLWWTGLYPRRRQHRTTARTDAERSNNHASYRMHDARNKRLLSNRQDPLDSHSRASSRSNTHQDVDKRATSPSHRRGSSVAGSLHDRKKKMTAISNRPLPTEGTFSSSRPTTPLGYESGSSEIPET